MKVDISIDEKTLCCILSFDLSSFETQKNYKDALAIIMMIAADYNLDPELEINDLEEIVQKGSSDQAKTLNFVINEDEIEADFS